MKSKIRNFAFSGALTVMLCSEIQFVSAHGSITHISRSTALPDTVQLMQSFGVTNYLELHVEGKAVESVSIALPPRIRITGDIVVSDELDRPIESSIQVNSEQIQIEFSQSVQPGKTIKFAIQGVKASRKSSSVYLYPIAVNYVEESDNIPVGTARIQIYE